MKKIYLSAFFLVATFMTSYAQETAQETSPCKVQCKVHRVVEEGVFLGVEIYTGPQGGAVIRQVFDNTAAQSVGLQPNFLITAVDNIEVKDQVQLKSIIKSHKAGDKVRISYTDNSGFSKQIKVRLGAEKTKIVETMECCEEIKNESSIALKDGLNVYPNPAKDQVNIRTKESLENEVQVLVYSQDGKEIYFSQKSMDGPLDISIPVSQYPRGNYFVRVVTQVNHYFAPFQLVSE